MMNEMTQQESQQPSDSSQMRSRKIPIIYFNARPDEPDTYNSSTETECVHKCASIDEDDATTKRCEICSYRSSNDSSLAASPLTTTASNSSTNIPHIYCFTACTRTKPTKTKKSFVLIETSSNDEHNQTLEILKSKFPSASFDVYENDTDEDAAKATNEKTTDCDAEVNIKISNCADSSSENDYNFANRIIKLCKTRELRSLNNSFGDSDKNTPCSCFEKNRSLSSEIFKLSPNTSIERQESKDSGFWSISKNSFESMKSLSIHDNHASEQIKPAIVSESSTGFTTSDTNATSSINRSHNWKKWKKEHTFRYNSSNSESLSSVSIIESVETKESDGDDCAKQPIGHKMNKSFDDQYLTPDYNIKKLEKEKSSMSQKRRGKLVRDITIDDEHSVSSSNASDATAAVICSVVSACEADDAHMGNGRVSPPEKRASFSFKQMSVDDEPRRRESPRAADDKSASRESVHRLSPRNNERSPTSGRNKRSNLKAEANVGETLCRNRTSLLSMRLQANEPKMHALNKSYDFSPQFGPQFPPHQFTRSFDESFRSNVQPPPPTQPHNVPNAHLNLFAYEKSIPHPQFYAQPPYPYDLIKFQFQNKAAPFEAIAGGKKAPPVAFMTAGKSNFGPAPFVFTPNAPMEPYKFNMEMGEQIKLEQQHQDVNNNNNNNNNSNNSSNFKNLNVFNVDMSAHSHGSHNNKHDGSKSFVCKNEPQMPQAYFNQFMNMAPYLNGAPVAPPPPPQPNFGMSPFACNDILAMKNNVEAAAEKAKQDQVPQMYPFSDKSNEIQRSKPIGFNFRYDNEKFINQLTANTGNNQGPMNMVLNSQFFNKTDKTQHPLEMFSAGSSASASASASASQDKNAQEIAKPHVCKFCQKKFARSDMLIRHSRLHSGIRPYKCNQCRQEFSRSDHLNTHQRTHTGEKPYSCPFPKCTYAACRKDMITRHLKVHNKNRTNSTQNEPVSASAPLVTMQQNGNSVSVAPTSLSPSSGQHIASLSPSSLPITRLMLSPHNSDKSSSTSESFQLSNETSMSITEFKSESQET